MFMYFAMRDSRHGESFDFLIHYLILIRRDRMGGYYRLPRQEVFRMKSRGARKSGRDSNVLPLRARLLTVAQLAELWQVSQRTIRRRIKDGEIRVIRIGRAVRIPE